MTHLTSETLARLVDERPNPDERAHLTACGRCAEEFRALRLQSDALGGLPALRPPSGDWEVPRGSARGRGVDSDTGNLPALRFRGGTRVDAGRGGRGGIPRRDRVRARAHERGGSERTVSREPTPPDVSDLLGVSREIDDQDDHGCGRKLLRGGVRGHSTSLLPVRLEVRG